jgi:hypothetical protein
VVKDASSEQSHSTARATSAGAPMRCMGMAAAAACCAALPARAKLSVRIGPGAAMRPDPALADVRGRLRRRFADQPRNIIEATVDDIEAEFSAATVRAFLPVLVERRAAARLQERSRT